MSATSVRPAAVPPPAVTQPKLERLALLYEGILTAAVRIQTGRQQVQEQESFRARMKQALREIASSAARKGYSKEDVEEAKFAVVAFLDEMILTHDPSANEWAQKSLGEELFGQRSAGEVFFARLEAIRANRDSQGLAEVLEVYYLCLLLGYEGKFAGAGAKAELQLLMTNLRERIERIYGLRSEFSPDGALPDEPMPVSAPPDPLHKQAQIFALAALLLAILCFLGFYLNLESRTADVQQAITQRVHP
jgi:type VI secretion system protein ImpK